MKYRFTRAASSFLCAVVVAVSAPGFTSELIFDTTNGIAKLDGAAVSSINGTDFNYHITDQGLGQFIFGGNLDLSSFNTVKGTGDRGVSLLVVGDVHIGENTTIDVSAAETPKRYLGSVGGPGGDGGHGAGGGALEIIALGTMQVGGTFLAQGDAGQPYLIGPSLDTAGKLGSSGAGGYNGALGDKHQM